MGHFKINKKTNNLLLALIIVVNMYVVVTPIVPALLFALGPHTGRRQELTAKLHPSAGAPAAAVAKPATDQPNNLVIPAMLLDKPVLEGRDTYAVLNKGILRLPASSTPDKGGNTVLIGHRFTYSLPKGVFYQLDKLKIGDEIGITWAGKQYLYTVASSKIVPPTETAVQAATKDARLTLYTCAPLLWPKDRLVVVATLATNPTKEPTP